jgi:hypothetical protein
MPWKECHVVDERLRFVARLLDGEKMTVPLRRAEQDHTAPAAASERRRKVARTQREALTERPRARSEVENLKELHRAK